MGSELQQDNYLQTKDAKYSTLKRLMISGLLVDL